MLGGVLARAGALACVSCLGLLGLGVGSTGAGAEIAPWVIGGESAKAGELRSLAFVAYRIPNGKDEANVCTGTVVAPRFVLTAAHCIHAPHVRFDLANFLIVTGAVNWKGPEREVSEVARAIVNPEYNSFSGQKDAALLELAAPVKAPPLLLAKKRFWRRGSPAEIAGWGMTRRDQHTPTYLLHRAAATVLGGTECRRAGGSWDQVCAIDPPPHDATTCFGDSGGPLLVRRPGDRRLVEIGLLRGATGGSCSPKFPSLYTSTASVFRWVQARLSGR